MKKYANYKVLVVDDEEFCLSAMKGLLFKAGINLEFQCDFCINGIEAIDLVKKMYSQGMKYRLILTDFNMPGMNGIKATYQIRQYLKKNYNIVRENQPVIIGITGHAHDNYKQEGIKAGMDKVEIKPVYFNVVNDIVEQYQLKIKN